MKYLYLLLLGMLCACSATEEQKINKNTPWRKMNCGLYMSPTGEIGFASNPSIANMSREELKLKGEICENRFLTLFNDDSLSLSSVIDTPTFVYAGASFYRDKNHIYHHYYAMCDGGYFNIFGEDTVSFKVLGDCYAFYKGDIYEMRNGFMKDVDVASFKTSKGLNCLAKDKHGYFEFGERTTRKDLEPLTPKELLDNLDQL